MATINKQYSFIWYGKCIDTGTTDGGCASFDLASGSESAKIDTVWQVDGGGNAKSWVNPVGGTFSTLECGHAYYIKLKGPTYNCEIPHAELSGYSQETAAAFRITEDCTAGPVGPGGAEFAILTTPITETLLEGYDHTDTAGNSPPKTGIITTATDIASVAITTTNNTHLKYSTDGSDWQDLTGTVTINSDFTNLQLRTKVGYDSQKVSNLTFVATTTGGFNTSPMTLTYTTNVSDVSISLGSNQTETLEEGESGTEKTFTITQAGLSSISVTTDETTQYHVSKVSGSGYATSVTFTGTDLNSSSVSVYVKLITNIGTSTRDATITATGTPSNGSTNISDTATITSNVKPRPVINSIAINQTNLDGGSITASITTSNIDGYLAHHWHYTISNDDGDIATSTNEMVNAGGGGFGPATINDVDVLNNPDDYTITAWIVKNDGHAQVSADPDQTKNFTIPVTATSMTLNKSAIDRDIDLESAIPTDTITINKANITNVSLSSLTNWTATLNGNSITVEYTGNTTITSVTEVAPETLTVTGTKGLRHGTAEPQIELDVTLNATLYKDAEFLISGNKSVTDNRTFGVDATESQVFTITHNKNVTYTVTGTLTNWQVATTGSYGTNLSVLEGMDEGDTFKFKHVGTNAETYAQETITFTPTPTAADGVDLGDPNPNIVEITLDSTISPGVATLTNPGSQTLVAVESGGNPVSKTVTVQGSNIKNIGATITTGDFTVSDVTGSVVTYNYTGSTTNIGIKTGTLEITAEAETNYKFAGNASSNAVWPTVSLEITPLVDADASGCNSPSPINIDVDATSGNSGTCDVSAINASFAQPTSPQGDFTVALNGNTLTYSITDITSVNLSPSANFNLTATADTNHAFSSQPNHTTENVNITLTGSVAGLATTLTVDDGTAIALGEVVQDADTTGKQITINDADNLASVTISVSGGGFEIIETPVPAAANGGYGTSDVTITNPLNKTFWIKFNSTGNAGGANSTVTVSGTKDEKGASDPADVVIDCTATITAGGGEGGADDCTACRGTDVVFDHSVDTIGMGENAPNDAAGITINGGELITTSNTKVAGSLCINNLGSGSLLKTHNQAAPVMLDDGVTMIQFQIVTVNAVEDGTIVYRASDGSFYGGELNPDGSEFTLSKIEDCIEGGGDGGGVVASGCAICDSNKSFDHSVDTIGMGENAPNDAAGITINGGELITTSNTKVAGSLCINNLGSGSLLKTHNQAAPVMLDDGVTMIQFQIVTVNAVEDGSIMYLASDGTCYEGELNPDGSEFTLSKKV